ncbi:MAG: hypothetical protein U5M51_09760 [Emticicia sp.]|nr:hypothetical protein [Emticicia sp.]
MNTTNLLHGLNHRITGDHYIGRKTIPFEANHLVRPQHQPFEIFPTPTLKYNQDSDVESFETLSIDSHGQTSSKPKSLEYRITGVTWYTPKMINSCSIDSFLSAWVRKIRQTHGRYLKFVMTIDRVGLALYEIGDHALCAKDSIDSEFVKGIWLIAVLKRTNEIQKMRHLPIDCTGNNAYSVFQHLENHCTFEIVSNCKCGTFYHYNSLLEIPDLKQLEILGNPKNLNSAEMPKCLKCNEKRILLELNPNKTHWLVAFHHYGSKARNNLSPLLSDIPQIIQFNNVIFKLEYITYVQDVPNSSFLHEVSLQFIRQKWYLYDGTKSPKFKLWSGAQYNLFNANLQSVVYFKI